MDACSVDAIVTDPPYHLTSMVKRLSRSNSADVEANFTKTIEGQTTNPFQSATRGFMGKAWDGGDIAHSPEVWKAALRVAKPGAYLLAFGGTRTFHRLAVAIEDAGWEIRDTVMWVYSSGFPKSMNLDRERGSKFCGCEESKSSPECSVRVVRDADVSSPQQVSGGGGQVLQPSLQEQGASAQGRIEFPATEVRSEQPGMEGRRDAAPPPRELRSGSVRESTGVGEADGAQGRVRDGASAGDGRMVRASADASGGGSPRQPQAVGERQDESGTVAGQPEPQTRGAWPTCGGCGKPRVPTGLGTALKPAWEPIIMARKPLAGTVAANVEKHGTGGLNIDACRIAHETINGGNLADNPQLRGTKLRADPVVSPFGKAGDETLLSSQLGRWPANLIHDGSEEVLAGFPETTSGRLGPDHTDRGKAKGTLGEYAGRTIEQNFGNDTGSASRFFYCAKASKADREDGLHGHEERPLAYGNQAQAEVKRGNTAHAGDSGMNTVKMRGNHHPTVKPTDLMRYLCNLVTPKGGTVLDPFMGSGSTLKAAELEGFSAIGIEIDPEYCGIARRRIASDAPLFAEDIL